MQSVSAVAKGTERSHSDSAQEALAQRVMETARLTDRRGYGLRLEEFARTLYGGAEAPERVLAAIARCPELSLVEGLVVRRDRAAGVDSMVARRESHGVFAQEAVVLADDFVGRLISSCPLVRSVSLTGSAASGGFLPGDDIDLNLVVRDGAKYTVYLWSIALSAVTSLRNRTRAADEMSALPFLPKIICINVVWEERQVCPLERRDKWLAFELLTHRPLLGAAFWAGVLRDNPWLGEHFPQVFDPDFAGCDSEEALRRSRTARSGRAFFVFLDRHPRTLRAVESLSRTAVISLHKLVSIYRTRNPGAREREAFVNLVKRPYSVYDVPGREAAVPDEALSARDSAAPHTP